MSKTMKIFLIIAGAAIGLAILLVTTGVGQGLVENVVNWLNDTIDAAIPGGPQIPVPTW